MSDVAPGPDHGAGRAALGQALAAGTLLSVVNGFVLASLQGAVGLVGREQTLLRVWVLAGCVMLPVYTAVVLRVLRRAAARRKVAAVHPLVAVAAIAVAGALTATVAMAAVAAWDVRQQDRQTAKILGSHLGHAAGSVSASGCDAICAAQHRTLTAHVKSVAIAAPVVLVLDAVATGWLIAAFGGEVAPVRVRRRVALDLSELIGTH